MIDSFINIATPINKPFTHISVFDLDHTLLSINSSRAFGVYLKQNNRISFYAFYKIAAYYLGHKLHLLSSTQLHQIAFECFFAKQNPLDIKALLSSFCANLRNNDFYSPAIEKLQQAKDCGHGTILMSNSPHFLVNTFAHFFGFNFWQATHYPIVANTFSTPTFFFDGTNKKACLQKFVQHFQIPIHNIYAYSDAADDLPLLSAVGNPTAVNPDRTLRQHALNHRWPII